MNLEELKEKFKIFWDMNEVSFTKEVENGRIYTIEGDSHDVCKQKDYDINSTEIRGYGTPVY